MTKIKSISILQQEVERIKVLPRVSKEDYLDNVNRLKQHIQLGDIYEVNYCQEYFADPDSYRDVKISPSSLAWPDRMEAPVEKLSLQSLARLDFEAPDLKRFPAMKLAREAIEAGGSAPAILNAANEVAVAAFLNEQISFLDIAQCVEEVLIRSQTDLDIPAKLNMFEDVYAIDSRARQIANDCIALKAI